MYASPCRILSLLLVLGSVALAQTKPVDSRLQQALKRFPDADANGDGILTMQEAQAYLAKAKLSPGVLSRLRGGRDQAPEDNAIFKATAEELDRAMQADTAANLKEPLQFPRGNGLRILSTGHSWVAPGLKTLPKITAAAGLDGHHVRSHTSGGAKGSANSIWRKEFGKFDESAPRPVLLPAIATGQWDVMTWGSYYLDVPEHYGQWIDVCLKSNPQMNFLIQDGWPRFDESLNKLEAAAALEHIDATQAAMQEGMYNSNYKALQKQYPGKVHIIPAGAAVVEMLHNYYAGKLPGFDCVSEHLGGTRGIYRDGGHLSQASGMEWLVGYMYYGMLYGKSPALIAGLQPDGVDPVVDAAMRKAAWNAIIHSPHSGIRDENGDSVADAAATTK